MNDADILLNHLNDAQSLLYHDFDDITRRVRELTGIITNYAQKHSPVYATIPSVIGKQDLYKKRLWYINGMVPYFGNNTTGTTSNRPFRYRIWSDAYPIIEQTHHYRAVLDEFGLEPPLKILYCLATPSQSSSGIVKIVRTDDIIVSHGLRQEAEVHRATPDRSYYTDNSGFYESLIKHSIEHKIDVILAQGTTVAAIAWHAARLGITDRICRLLSNTGSKLNVSDAESLKDAGIIGDWCDHMRCWDGGATFITCKHHVYHLQDALSYSYEVDGKLISTDYFSLPSPFVNYWNGDYCTIDQTYQRCKCGRAYRPFSIDRTRDMNIWYRNTGPTKEALLQAAGGHKIKRIEGYKKNLLIILNEHLKLSEKAAIIAAANRFDVQFSVEHSN